MRGLRAAGSLSSARVAVPRVQAVGQSASLELPDAWRRPSPEEPYMYWFMRPRSSRCLRFEIPRRQGDRARPAGAEVPSRPAGRAGAAGSRLSSSRDLPADMCSPINWSDDGVWLVPLTSPQTRVNIKTAREVLIPSSHVGRLSWVERVANPSPLGIQGKSET